MKQFKLSQFRPYGLEHCGFITHPDTGEWCKLWRNSNGHFRENPNHTIEKLSPKPR